MRILFWNQLFLPSIGGVEMMTARIGHALVARGHEVAVVASRSPSSLAAAEVIDGIPVYRFAFTEALSPGDARVKLDLVAHIVTEIGSLKRQFRPDVIHINLLNASPYFHLCSRNAHSCPSVLMFHAMMDSRFMGSRIIRAVMNDAARVVAPCKAGAINVAEITAFPLEAIQVVAPGIPAARALRGPDMPKGGGLPSFIFVGRLVDYKGADIAIKAIARLDGAARLRIVGDGPDRKKLEQLVTMLGIAHLVEFDGAINDQQKKDRLLAESFAAVVPSYKELFGTVAAEAALVGLPVIATRIGGLPESVVEGVTGLLVPSGDVGALAEAMLHLVNAPELARQMGAAAREHALKNYTLERTVDEFERMYTECARELNEVLSDHTS